jgi:hypothetical protein
VSPGYCATLQIPLRSGRDFNEFDVASSIAVAVVNKALAERLFATANAVGRQLREGRAGRPIEIVGVVEDGKYAALAETKRPAIFRPQSQQCSTSSMIIVRSELPESVRPHDLSRLIHAIDPGLPIRSAATGDEPSCEPCWRASLPSAASARPSESSLRRAAVRSCRRWFSTFRRENRRSLRPSRPVLA